MEESINMCIQDINAAKVSWVKQMKTHRINPECMRNDMVDRQLELELYKRMCYFDLNGSIAAFDEWKNHVQSRMDKHLLGELVVHNLCDFTDTTGNTAGQDAIALKLAEEFKSRTDVTRASFVHVCYYSTRYFVITLLRAD
jgi:hypothetical protein